MRRLHFRWLAFVLIGIIPLGPANAQSAADPFVPFEQFLAEVSAAKPEMYLSRQGARVQAAATFEEMRRHILTMYEGVTAVRSFVVDRQPFDCVPVEQQPSVRRLGIKRIATPPPPSPSGRSIGQNPAPGEPVPVPAQIQPGKDRFGNTLGCEKGTIPLRRITLDELTRFQTLRQFFQKAPDGGGRPPTQKAPLGLLAVTHKYAHAYQFVNNHGGNSWLNLWSPAVNVGAGQVFSLAQHWYVGGSGANLQTVEGGWQVYPNKYGTNAALFIYWTADGYSGTGCYNLDCAAFVQVSPNWHLGGTWSTYSTLGGPQYEFQLQWKLAGGNWWLFLQGSGGFDAVGYYPGSIYRGGQLTRNATEIDYGGETVGSTSWPPMGSGEFANQGWQRAAYQRLIFYLDTGDVSQWSGLTTAEPSPSCYTAIFTPAAWGGSWGSYLFFGGPGGTGC